MNCRKCLLFHCSDNKCTPILNFFCDTKPELPNGFPQFLAPSLTMRIKELIVDGFKSYANRVCISGWDSQFNAITGLNGSGKSNILDSICFVLGISQLKQVRANNLQELVYKQGQSRVTKATVTIIFDNTDKKNVSLECLKKVFNNSSPTDSPLGYETFDEITVSRQVVIGGRNKYMINGHTAQQNRVKNLFHSVQLNVNNPHFLIMQGRITKVINMKPPEILSMIEEAAGTRMYESGKQSAMKTISKKQAKVEEINKILTEDITPSLEKLRKERSSYMQWTANKQEIERLDRLVIAAKYLDSQETSNKSKDDVQELQNEHEALLDENKNAEAKKVDISKRVSALLKNKEDQMEGSFKIIEKRATALSKELVKHTSVWEHKKQEIKSEQKLLKESKVAAKKHEKLIVDKENEIKKFAEAKMDTETKERETREKVASLQGQQIGITMSDSKEDQGSLTNQLMDKQRVASELEAAMTGYKQKMKHLEGELKEKEKLSSSEAKQCKKLKSSLEATTAKHLKLSKKLDQVRINPERMRELSKSIRICETTYNKKTESYEALAAEMARYDFKYDIQSKSFDHNRVKGLVAKLIKIKDPKTLTAIEVTAGGKLFQVVVDSESTGKTLLEKGRLRRRVTIIPLNKIAARAIDTKIVKEAQKLVGKENADLALSLVGYDDEVERAMVHVFGRTFICRDSLTAKKVTFNPNIRTKSVTLDGDVYDPRGTLTGGSSLRKTSILSEFQKLSQLQKEVGDLERQLKGMNEEMQKLKKNAEKAKEYKMQVDLALHEVKLNETKLNESSYMKFKAEADKLSEELSTCKSEMKKQKAELAAVRKRCSEIEASIKDYEKEKKKQQKRVEKELKASKKSLEALNKELKRNQQKYDQACMELQSLKEEHQNNIEQCKKIEKGIETLEKEELVLSDMVKKASEAYMEKNGELEAKRAGIAACDNEIQDLVKQKNGIEKDISSRELQAKKLTHKISRMVSDTAEAKKTVERMKKKHPWIAQECHLFGKPHTDYDFKRNNPRTAKSRLEKLKKKQDDISKKLNTKVMGMFERAEQEYQDLLKKRDQVTRDKQKIHQTIEELDRKKNEALETTWQKVNKDFGSIFSACLPGTSAKLSPQEGKSVLEGLEVKVAFNGVWKQSLTELSGGQRSLLALSLILALLRFKPAPMYILDEVDAALDLSHTQNIGQMLKKHFPQSQFIVVSLKEGMFNNANVIFRTKFIDGVSTVKKVKGTRNKNTVDKENRPVRRGVRQVGKSKRTQLR